MIKVKKNITLKKSKNKKIKSLKNKIEINNITAFKSIRKKRKTMSNQKIIDMLETMQNIMFMNSEPFKARAYNKAKETVMIMDSDIKNKKDVEGKNGFRKGGSVLKILEEFLKNGVVKKIEDTKSDMRFVFNDIYGVGPKNVSKTS